MRASTERVPISSSTAALSDESTDLLALPWFEGDGVELVPEIDAAVAQELGCALSAQEFTGRLWETFWAPVQQSGWKASRVVAIGAGRRAAFDAGVLRRLATTVASYARDRRIERATFICPRGIAPSPTELCPLAQAIAEGLTLAEFRPGTYKTSPAPWGPPARWTIGTEYSGADVEHAIARGWVLATSTNAARALANEPPNVLTPREFAERAVALAAEGQVTGRILEPDEIESLGMGMLLAVGRGSAEPSRVVVLRYDPPNAPATPVLGLVGKGVTFDTGGISIKPADGMDRMKDDMSGGAAVAAAMRAIGCLGAPISVVGVIPIAENMPGGRACRPGDVVKSAEGKSVEILNTDAEGRLLLGDALWYARQLGATHLVDVATLTGAVVVALGKGLSGLFGTPETWLQEVRRCADGAGDPVWPLPLHEEYREQLKSEIADFSNTGGRPAGSITAALFLKEFVGALPWAHLDIAGTAWAEEARPYMPKGPTGVAVRTLAELACGAGRWTGVV
jgi:leucyl aminopeptidase